MPIKSGKIFCYFILAFLGSLLYAAPNQAAEAPNTPVVLAHQWNAGQKWVYGVRVAGKMDLRFPPGTPMVARMSFKGIDFSLANSLTLDVLKVNEEGEASIALRFDNIEMSAGSAAGRVEIKNDEMRVYSNGQPFGQPNPVQLNGLRNPNRAIRLNARGHFSGSEPIPGAPASQMQLPPHLQNLFKAFNPDLLPALWPDKPVAPGAEWTNEVLLPLQTDDAEAKRAGSFQWTYVGEETDPQDATRKLQRLRLEGLIKISADQATQLAQQIGDNRPGTPQDTIQKLSGDVLFDTEVGQVHSADLKLQFYSARQAQSKIGERVIDDSSWTIFDGTMQLNRVNATPAN